MKKVIALLLAAVMVFALCACGQQGAEGKDPAAKLPEFKLGIPMENTANPAQYSYLENMVYLCGNFPNGGTAVAEADDLTDPDHMISSVEKLISAGCNMITICPCNDTMLIKVAKLCEENKVYWAVAWRDILDPEVRDVVYASPYFCGTAVQSDLNAGYAAVKAMGEAGMKKIGLISLDKSSSCAALREKGMQKALDEYGMPPMDISESKNISRAIPHLDSSINVSETLQRAHIPYSVYTSFHPEQWGKAKMLIVSDAPNMSKENMSALKAYVEDGGIAYISGHSAQPLVEEIFGGKITGRTDETITYIAPEDEVAPLFGEYSRKYPLTVYDSAYILEGATNGKVLAKLTLPYSLQASSFLVCADLELQVEADPNDPRNESASMHSDPPGIATDYPAMMEAEVGKGKIIWVCAPFENTSLTQPRKVFTSFVKKYVPEMRFASDDTPYVVEYQLWEDEEGKYLSAINLQYADEVLPVFDFNICIRTEKPAKITRVSDGREMGFEYSDGKLVLHIDRLDLYEMFDIQI